MIFFQGIHYLNFAIKSNRNKLTRVFFFYFILQNIRVIRINIVHCSNDHILRMAGILLCSTIQILANQRPQIGMLIANTTNTCI